MKLLKAFAFGLSGLALASSAGAAVVLNDNFDSYTNGTLSVQGGWTITGTAPATPNPIQVSGATDKIVTINNAGQDEYKAFTSVVPHTDGNSILTSFTANVTAALATGDYFSHLSNPAGTTSNFYQRVFARSSGAGFQLGLVDTSGTGSTTTWGSTVLTFGTEYDIDVTWNFVAGTLNDTFSLTVNGSPYLTHTWTSTATAEPTNLAAANLRQGTAANAPTVQFDDYLITEVVPEPTGIALLGLGAAGFLARRRRAC